MKTDVYIQLDGQETDCNRLTDTAKEIWKSEGNKVKDIKTMEIYFKPAESSCYYVINGSSKGSFTI